MKKITLILIVTVLMFQDSFSQILNNYCSDFQSYKQMINNSNNYLVIDFEDNPVMSFGSNLEKAKYNAKANVLKRIMYNQVYLDNPIVDTILSQFAGELIKISNDDFSAGKSPKKYRSNGKFASITNKASYNKLATEFLKEKIDYFLKSQAVFIINPFVNADGDPLTKQIYNDARQKFLTALGASKFKLDGIKETKMLEFAELSAKPTDYNPCMNGFLYYKTGNKYLDFVTAMVNNSNRTINVDFIFTIDTITITKTPDQTKKVVTFHILAIDAHNASIVMVYDLNDSIDANNSDFDCVKNSINWVFNKNADIIMYELIKRYSNYIRDGAEFSLLICENILKGKQDKLEEILATCNLFVKGSIKPGQWREKGTSIGFMYTGRTYLLDPLLLRANLRKILNDAGLSSFSIDVSGMTYVITQQNN